MDRSHVFVCGVTRSGKTTLVHRAAQEIAENNRRLPMLARKSPILVYDPVRTKTAAHDWPDQSIIFTRKDRFLNYLMQIQNSEPEIFIDEADNLFSHDQRENAWILTKGRHFGFRVWVITQRPKMVSPSVRNQCGICFCFRLARSDMKEVGDDYGHDIADSQLDRGDFIYLESGSSQLSRHNIFSIVKGQTSWSITSKQRSL